MVADPGQKADIAQRRPEITQRLASAYEVWYRDVTSRGVDAPPLPVGHKATDLVALQAEDAELRGGLKFRRHAGWAHDSILNWKSKDDSAVWNLDVLQSGCYEITLMYGCMPQSVGTKIRIRSGDQHSEATIQHAHDPLPEAKKAKDRAAVWTHGPVPQMTWTPVQFTPINFQKGPAQLEVHVVGWTELESFELKEARFRRIK
jgi:arylsulfatase A